MERLFKITVNGTSYDVAVEDLNAPSDQFMPNYSAAPVAAAAAPVAAAPAKAAPVAAGAGDQCAQMGGVIASLLVKEGATVAEGDKIIELEAMKMKMPVIATRSGKVSRILVAVGESVVGGQVLLVIS